jgi:outer membrane immunogenic protein
MKKLLIIAFLFSAVISLKAQETGTFGVSAGINVANMSFKSQGVTESLTSLVGFKGYVFYDLPLGGSFSLENELGFDGMGAKLKDPTSGITYTESLSYLTLAILPKFNVPQTGLSIYLGPSLGYLLSAKSSGGGQSASDTDNYNSIDLFGEIGASYYLPMGFGLTARYMAGITNIVKDAQSGESGHNSAFSITLAYKFGAAK